jgi:hypothetical protein
MATRSSTILQWTLSTTISAFFARRADAGAERLKILAVDQRADLRCQSPVMPVGVAEIPEQPEREPRIIGRNCTRKLVKRADRATGSKSRWQDRGAYWPLCHSRLGDFRLLQQPESP